MAGMVYLVGAGPGDPGLITVRGVECLARADVVVVDHLVSAALVERYVPHAAEVVKRPAGRSGPLARQDEIDRLLVERARAGKIVVRLKGGDPFLFGRGGEEAEALAAAGVPFEVVPGVTAAVAVPAYAGIPLTHRGAAAAITFATGHEADKKEGGAVDWQALARGGSTLVLYMSVTHLDDVVQRLLAAGRAPDEPAAVIEWGTTDAQRTVVAPLAELPARVRDAGVQPPALTVVGPVVALREPLAWFEPRRILLVSTKDERPVVGASVTRVSPLKLHWRADDVGAALEHLGRFAWVAFSSAHAVDAVEGALVARGLDVRALAGRRLAAVGEATTRRLCALCKPDLVGRAGGAALADEILAAGGGPTLVVRAAGGREELAERLRAAGQEVEVLDAYEAVPDEAALAAAAATHRERPFAALAFTSPRGAAAFVEAVGGVAALGRPLIGAIGATTRAALVELGLTVDVMPAQPSAQALVDELGAALARRGQIE
jgi:uroporphyrinogen III methyltransferase/synthase